MSEKEKVLPEPGRVLQTILTISVFFIPCFAWAEVTAGKIAILVFGGEHPFPSVAKASKANIKAAVWFLAIVLCLAAVVLALVITVPPFREFFFEAIQELKTIQSLHA